ncbi:MAG: hypothetical protein FD170_3777 [Bacteroidetes bacterium]|nr:MAG: hypothetical protein FD170_3777 [Bacteroidota bacterium]
MLSICLYMMSQAQSPQNVETLLPMDHVNQQFRKVHNMVAELGSMTHIDLIADLNSYNACYNGPEPGGVMHAEFIWYNSNDETGKFMLQLLKDMDGINQQMNEFKNSSGMDVSEANESDFMGGKLWTISTQKECVNEISGNTGVTSYQSSARYFLFNGTTILKLDISCACKPDKVKEMISFMAAKTGQFDFASVKSSSDH